MKFRMKIQLKILPLILAAMVCSSQAENGLGDDYLMENVQGDTSTDILEQEGESGWFEKLMKLGEKEIQQKRSNSDNSGKREFDFDMAKRGKAPPLAQAKLSDAFNKIGPEADGAKNGLAKINDKWNELSSDDRSAVTRAFQASVAHFEKFAKANEDPVGAVRASIDIVSQFSALAGPTGQIVSIALSFVSGFLSLFGIGKSKAKRLDIGQIVRKELDEALVKYYDKVLNDEISGVLHTFVISKAYVDSLSQSGGKLTEHQALSLKVHVPLFNGLKLLGKLKHRISELLNENKSKNVKRLLKYIELYTRLASLKDMILLQSIALIPDARNQGALLAAQRALRKQQKVLLEFLFQGNVKSKLAVLYFDPDFYPITDKYLSAMLKVPNYDRSMAGTWCISQKGYWSRGHSLGIGRRYRDLMINRHPYLTSGGVTCQWKLVPHGNNLFTIAIHAWGCPRNPFCGKYVSHDIVNSNKLRMTVEPEPALFEITGNNHQKRIRSKWGCDTGSKWCNAQPYFSENYISVPWRVVEVREYTVILATHFRTTFVFSKSHLG